MTKSQLPTHITGVALLKNHPFMYIASTNDGTITYGRFYIMRNGFVAAGPTLAIVKIVNPVDELLIVGSIPLSKLR